MFDPNLVIIANSECEDIAKLESTEDQLLTRKAELISVTKGRSSVSEAEGILTPFTHI